MVVPSRSQPVSRRARANCCCSRTAGFSLLEIVVVVALLVMVAALGIPTLQQMIVRTKLMGAAQEVAAHLLRSRLEAMKMSRTVVVEPDYAALALVSWIDENDDLVFDAATEDEIYRLAVPGDSGSHGLFFMGPNGIVGTAAAPSESLDGFTPVGGTGRRALVFEPDGSIRHPGALRIADTKSPERNVIEVRVAPQATARIEVRKYIYDSFGGPAYRPYGAGLWDWY